MTYVVFYTIPVHPGCLVVQCGGPGTSTPAQLKAADHLIGADRPVVVQYGHFVWNFVRHGTLGTTFQGDVPVTTLLKQSLPVTASLVLGGAALLLLHRGAARGARRACGRAPRSTAGSCSSRCSGSCSTRSSSG